MNPVIVYDLSLAQFSVYSDDLIVRARLEEWGGRFKSKSES
jgi:hypothetical protein